MYVLLYYYYYYYCTSSNDSAAKAKYTEERKLNVKITITSAPYRLKTLETRKVIFEAYIFKSLNLCLGGKWEQFLEHENNSS